MSKIDLKDNMQNVVIKLCMGNVGALQVCMDIFKQAKIIDPYGALGGLGVLLSLDDMEIYGSHIWILYKDICKQNLVDMLAVLRAKQLGYIYAESIKHAILNRGQGVDVKNCYVQVKKRLPNFAKN